MEEWLRISLLLCGFGFIREIRPSEPFVSDYLMYPWRNVTSDEVNRSVFPIGTYSYATQLILIFLLTDYFRYKPIIILSAISGIIVWAMLVWTKTLLSLQILEIFYGTYMATEVGYYTYIYAKVDKKHYLKTTSHSRAAVLTGRFAAATMGQIFVLTKLADYRDLHLITFGAQILALLWTFLLPSVQTSQYFHPKMNDDFVLEELKPQPKKTTVKTMDAIKLLKSHIVSSYSNYLTLIWSIWYAAAMCGYLQVVSYIQVLWKSIDNSEEIIWNGAVEACSTLIGAIVSLLAGHLHLQSISGRKKIWALLLLSMCQGLAIMLTSFTSSRSMSYVGYLIFYTLYSFMITVASAEIAHHIEDDCFGLVFGLNTLIALFMQTILTLLVVSGSWLSFTIFEQYTIYSYYFISVGILYFLAILYDAVASCI